MDTKKYNDFVSLVREMRKAQEHRNDITTTFETLSQLEEADKRQDLLEKAVDKWLEENL